MQFDLEALKGKAGVAWQQLFGGRISRTTFVIRTAIFFCVASLVALPPTTILATSTRFITDAYLVFWISMIALCLLGFVSAYVKRLHDIGLRGFWAILILIAIPMAIVFAMVGYTDYLVNQDPGADSSPVESVGGTLMWGLALILALWRGEAIENRFGPVPDPVEHVAASKFNIVAVVGAAAILIPTCIYVGLFQPGVWVGRSSLAPSMPLTESSVPGYRFMKCWNVKGVGAGSGKGTGSGVYRDGYTRRVFEFIQTPNGQIDIATAGEGIGSSYLTDGFRIVPYGLQVPESASDFVNVRDLGSFMLVAVFDHGGPNAAINYTTFTFGRNKSGWPEYHVVMSSALRSSSGATAALDFPEARGRLMIGDCMPG